MSAAGAFGYPPFDVPKLVAPDLWIVDAEPMRAMGIPMPVRMTVVRLPDGELWLHSPTRCSRGLLAELLKLGPIRHLVAPSVGHWTFLADWQAKVSDSVTWGVSTLRRRPQVRMSRVRLDRDLGPEAPRDWAGTLRQQTVPGFGGFREAAFLHEPSRTLILTDLISNLEADRVPASTRLYARLSGTMAPRGSTPNYLRLSLRLRRAAARGPVSRILDWAPERVIFAHGRWFENDGARRLAEGFEWLGGVASSGARYPQ